MIDGPARPKLAGIAKTETNGLNHTKRGVSLVPWYDTYCAMASHVWLPISPSYVLLSREIKDRETRPRVCVASCIEKLYYFPTISSYACSSACTPKGHGFPYLP